MKQPPSFTDPQFPNHVCELHKSLYGLKHGILVFSGILVLWVPNQTPFCLARKIRNSQLICSFMWMILSLLACTMINLKKSFTNFTLHFSSRTLVLYIIFQVWKHFAALMVFSSLKEDASLICCNGPTWKGQSHTPMCSTTKLSKLEGSAFHDVTFYRSIVGALQNLTLTRLYTAFSVNKVCQFI